MTSRTALDGARRRRLYLFRHGSVDYIDANGDWVPDPDVVDLNDRGVRQAEAMAALFDGVHVDRAMCSGLPRTVQTAERVLGARELALESTPGFEEIRPPKGESAGGYDIVSDIAFSHWRAEDSEARFLGGETYHEFYDRIVSATLGVLAEEDWDNLALFAHGGTNSAILGWVTGVGLRGFGLIDQATCCLNIIDFDIGPDGVVLRKVIRGMNVTADDPVMRRRDHGDMEALAKRLIAIGGG